MITEDYKTMNEFEEFRNAYYDAHRQLYKMRECFCALYEHLYARRSILMEMGVDEDLYCVVESADRGFKDIESAMQKLEKALEGTSVLIEKCQAYMEAEKDFAQLLGDKP